MSTSAIDPTLAGLLQTFMGGGTQTPQTVINMQPNAADQLPAVGSPDYGMGYGNDIDPMDDDMIEVDRYGSPDDIGEFSGDMSGLSEFASELARTASYGGPDDYGSIWSRITAAANRTAQSRPGVVGDAARKINQVVSQVNKNSKFLSTLNKRDFKTEKRLRKIERHARNVHGLLQKEFGSKHKWYRAALAASHALPGIRALNLFESTQPDDVLKKVIDFGDAVEDMKPQTEDNPYTLTPTSGAPTAPEVAVQVQELAQGLEDIRRDLVYLTTALTQADLKTVVTAFDDAKEASIISQLSKIIPNQVTRQDEAIAQAAIKYVFGQVGNSGNLLNISI